MSTITIQVISTAVSKVKSYQQMIVTHISSLGEGKTETKKLLSFVTPEEVWKQLEGAKNGDHFSITREKTEDGKYWNWVGIARSDEMPKEEKKTFVSNTYTQKVEFDKDRQISIVRQSSLKAAVEYMAAFGKGTTFTPAEVIKVAKEFENYVNGIDMIADMVNDIPE